MAKQTDRPGGLLGKRVQERLHQLGMSRRELARRANLSRQTIHNIEHEGATNLKPSTLKALDKALKWEDGTALALALGTGDPGKVHERLNEYLCRIAIHLAHMDAEQLELTLIMLEENELGKPGHSTEDFILKVGTMVDDCLKKVAALQEVTDHQHAS